MKEDNEIRFDVENPFCCGGILPLAQSFVQPERLIESLAGFVQFDYKVNEKLNVTAGYRYTRDTKEDIGGRNYITAGYRQPNIGLYDSADPDLFWFESWTRLGLVPTATIDGSGPYQSNVLTNDMGTSGDDFSIVCSTQITATRVLGARALGNWALIISSAKICSSMVLWPRATSQGLW